MKKIALVSTLLFAACGGGGDNPDAPPHPDAPMQPDAAPACTTITLMPTQFAGASDTAIAWTAGITEDLGDGGPASLNFEYYDVGVDLMGTFDLAQSPDDNYATCASCLRAFTTDADGNPVRQFFQSAGNEMLTVSPLTPPEPAVRNLMGSVDGLTLIEVTIDPDNNFMSTPVAGGQCLTISTIALNDNDVPDTWTCAPEAYGNQDAICDCTCGTGDPDCDGTQTTTNGCTAAETCFAGACATPPPNETCALAIPLVLGTPATGSSAVAANDYEVGTDTATCASDGAGGGYLQPGSDVAYSIVLTAGQTITATLSTDPTFDSGVYLLGPGLAACSADVTGTCVAGSDQGLEGDDETFTYTAAAAGTYYVVVDSFYPAGDPRGAGNFTLTVN